MSQLISSNQSSTAASISTKVEYLYPTISGIIMDKLPAFLYLLAEDYSIQYANGYFNRQFGKTDTLTPCYSVMRRRTSPCNPCPAQTVFKERKEQVWTWQDKLRGQLYEVHDYPFPLEDGNILVLGLGINIQRKRQTKKAPKTIQSCLDVLRICCHCKDINEDNGKWEHIETYLKNTNDMQFTHGVCPECLTKYYPEVAKKFSEVER